MKRIQTRPKTLALLVVLGLTAALLCGCKKKRDDEAVEAVVAADRQLMNREKKIMTRRGSLQRERKQLRDKRAQILTKKATLASEDTKGRQALEAEETKLAGLEAKLVKQEIGLNRKLQSLLTEKSGLVNKLASEKAGAAREMLAARREYSVALREKDLTKREADLATREKTLATREQALAVRQANVCPRGGQTVVVQAPRATGGGGGTYTRRDVEPVFRSALKAMRTKGILTADLPPGVDRLVTETRHGVSKGDFTRAKYAADQLLATVRTMKINRAFIGAKIGRLSNAMRRSRPSAAARPKVDKLFQEATANYGDGRFRAANSKLNRIYGLLR
jgi:hypothetical protein